MKSTVICVISIIFVLVIIQESTAQDIRLIAINYLFSSLPKCPATIPQQFAFAVETVVSIIDKTLGHFKDTVLNITACHSLSCLRKTASELVHGFDLISRIILEYFQQFSQQVLWFGYCLGVIGVKIAFPCTRFIL
ncbi:uncharacterized protein LOC115886994 isoform X1 [Sitophilus oryzae]|uniref:Uncharacterized protein LOC115886994 isoform X1 n=1 Tax=Sitophilus oryzae TaxID=7048 RepID=A0A6J2YE70_SITOR|nr:uncharacterized protein LOC115886994 isoform X1 [Sitophilus oryzae]